MCPERPFKETLYRVSDLAIVEVLMVVGTTALAVTRGMVTIGRPKARVGRLMMAYRESLGCSGTGSHELPEKAVY